MTVFEQRNGAADRTGGWDMDMARNFFVGLTVFVHVPTVLDEHETQSPKNQIAIASIYWCLR